MTKWNRKKIVPWILAVILLLGAYAWYARPVTIVELYPMLELDRCTKMEGFYEIGMQAEATRFTIEKGSEDFSEMCSLFYGQKYRRSLADLLPRGTRYHQTQPDDFQWDVYFYFENVEFPDGSSGSGGMLHFSNWYGTFSISFDGQTHFYKVRDSENWAEQVLEMIQ